MITINGKDYEARNLLTTDLGTVSKIFAKLDFDLGSFVKEVKGKTLTEEELKKHGMEIGFSIASHLIKNYHKADEEMAEWLASIIGVSVEEYKKMPIDAPVKIFKALSEKHDLADFFKQAVS